MNASSVILIAFFTALLTAVGTVVVMKQGGMLTPDPAAAPAADGQVVPDLVGLGETEARASTTNAKLAFLVISREASAGKKAGSVLRQSIPAGQRVPANQPLGVVLADELPKVPKVVGLTLAEATARLEQSGHKLTTAATVSDPTVPEGKIMDQIPGADEGLETGGTVAVRVSGGPGDIEVPRVTGMTAEQAETLLEKAGFKVVTQWTNVAESQGLIVLRQTPAAGQKAKKGNDVEIVANR
jgi:beta-lactam-binding protein with PASTA domain